MTISENYCIFFLLIIISLIIITTVSVRFIIIKLQESKESEFIINHNILINIIDTYKEIILENKIAILRSKFDLNERSKTNSLAAFEKEKNDLISETVKKIMKEYLSKSCLNYLVKRYGIDGLSLLILAQLKK